MPKLVANTDKRIFHLVSVLAMGLAIWSYLPTLKFEFTFYDDQHILLEQSELFAHGSVGQRVENIVLNSYPREEPLIVRDLSWLLDSIVFEPGNPFGYHFSNVLYHGLVIFLAFWLLVRLINFRVAVISISIIAVLAVHTEPVAWIMGRKDILSALFCLLSMHLYLRYKRQSQKGLQILLYGAMTVCSVAAYLSKISALVLPILLALVALFEAIDADKSKRAQFGGKYLTRTALEIAPVLLLAIGVFAAYHSNQENYGVLARVHEYSVSDYLKVAFIINPLVLIEYIKMVVAPYNFFAFYDEPSLDTVSNWFHYTKAISVFSIIGLIAWHMWRTNRKALIFLTCFFVILLPYANWKHFGFWYANRYVYFAALFLVPALVSYLLPYFNQSKNWSVKVALLTVFLLVVFNNYNYRQEHLYVWQNGETLWLNEVSRPDAPLVAYNNLTSYYISRAKYSTETARGGWLDKAKAINQVIFNMPIRQRDQELLAITHVNGAATTDDALQKLDAYTQAIDIAPGYSTAQFGMAITNYKLAMSEQNEEQKMLYAQQSLHYFRQHLDNSGTLSSTRDRHSVILNQLQAKFPGLEIPELNNTVQ
jgi:hypothetical protein